MRILIGIFLFALTAPCFAQPRTVEVLGTAKFDALNASPAQLNPSVLYYNDRVLTFADWNKQSPTEAQALNLYPGFTEPEVTAVKFGVSKKVIEKMMVFIVRAKMVLNKAPGQINLANLTKIESIRKFSPELKQQPIQPNQFMQAVAGKGQINNFKWCSPDAFKKPSRETDLSYLNPKGRANWCSDTAHSLCVETCYLFNTGYSAGIAAVNIGKEEREKKDYGIGYQSEIRYFSNEQESGSPVPLKDITGISTPVRGGLEQNSFYFNQLFQYAKILGVLQDHPADAGKTIATVYFVIGIKQRTWNINSQVPVILRGESKYLNTASGITAGIPVFTQTILKSIAGILEN